MNMLENTWHFFFALWFFLALAVPKYLSQIKHWKVLSASNRPSLFSSLPMTPISLWSLSPPSPKRSRPMSPFPPTPSSTTATQSSIFPLQSICGDVSCSLRLVVVRTGDVRSAQRNLEWCNRECLQLYCFPHLHSNICNMNQYYQ